MIVNKMHYKIHCQYIVVQPYEAGLAYTLLFATLQFVNVSNGANENDSFLSLTPF